MDYGILIQTFGNFGFSKKDLAFMKSYLLNRLLQVRIRGCVSDEIRVKTGVPQSNNLEPLHFPFFINDLPECLTHTSSLIFAKNVHNHKITSNWNLLQLDLQSVSERFELNSIYLTIEECAVMTYTRKVNYITSVYKLNNIILQRKTVGRNLGVYIQSN